MASPVDHFARTAGEPNLAPILQRLVTDSGGFAGLRIDMSDIGNMNRQLLLDDAARFAHPLASMSFGDMHTLDDDARLAGKHAQHLSRPPLIAPGDDDHIVALLDFQLRHVPAPR